MRYSPALTQADSLEIMVLDGSTIVKREQVSLAGTSGTFAYDMALPYEHIAGKTLTVRVTPVFDSSYVPVEPADTLRKLTNPKDASLTVPYLQLPITENLTATVDGARATLRWDAVANNSGYEVVLEHQSSTGANFGTYRTVTAADALSHTFVLGRAVGDGDRLTATVIAKGSDARKQRTLRLRPIQRSFLCRLPIGFSPPPRRTPLLPTLVLHWKPVSGAVRYQVEALDVQSGEILVNAPDASQTHHDPARLYLHKGSSVAAGAVDHPPYDRSGNSLDPLQVTVAVAKREDAHIRVSAAGFVAGSNEKEK